MTSPFSNDDLEILLQRSVAQILKSEDPIQFLRWFDQSAEVIAPNFFSAFADGNEALRSFKSYFSRFIWNRTHLPSNHFRPMPLPKPERNAPCVCGSGLKYKQCCLRIEATQDELPNMSMLPFVLDALTAKQRADLPYEYLSPEELEHVARQWMEEGRTQDAAKLLEGLLKDLNKVDARAEATFDCLLDCYDVLGNTLKKKNLLERGLMAPDKRLRAAAMQRRCCILADHSQFTEAWSLFQDLQRLVPNDPSLSHLEITILISQGEHQRAIERAKFWVARLARDPEFNHGSLIEYLRGIAQGNIAGAMNGIARELSPELGSLVAMLDQLPPLACHYSLKPMGDSAGPLIPDIKLQSLIAQWEVQADFSERIGDDIEWLQRNPLVWNCFEILNDWLGTLEDERISHGFEEVVLIPALRRSEALLRMVLAHHQAASLKFEWGWLENRPALSLLQRLVGMLRLTHNTAEAVRVAEWMVMTLNPNDNQGMRDHLIHDYLRLGQVDKALALAANYPDDMAAMQYGSALALFMGHQEQSAQERLKTARKRYPEVAKMLLADKPKQPQLRDGLVQVGGKDEAWYYRQDHFDLWQKSGGLAWLTETGKKC